MKTSDYHKKLGKRKHMAGPWLSFVLFQIICKRSVICLYDLEPLCNVFFPFYVMIVCEIFDLISHEDAKHRTT